MKGNQSKLMHALYEAGLTRRWHTTPLIGDDMVARHSWGVLVFILTFHDGLPSTDELDAPAGPSPALLRAAALHDVHERWSGDSPNPTRKCFPGAQQAEDECQSRFWNWAQPLWADFDKWHPEEHLTERERAWLKLADAAEALLFCQYQMALGNRLIAPSGYSNMVDAVRSITQKYEHCFLDAEGLREAVLSINLANRLPDHMDLLEENH